MPSIARSISKGFWAQYPVSTKLNWSFFAQQVNIISISLSNLASRQSAYIGYCVRDWQFLVIPYFAALGKTLLRPYIPRDSRVARIVYVAILYPSSYVICALGFVLFSLLSALLFTITLVLTVVLVLMWMVLMSVTFSIWLVSYRYPIVEILYPRVRQWMLVNNSKVYSCSCTNSSTIRIVCLEAGSRSDDIVCKLITGPLPEMSYEALSYVWGVTVVPYKISIDQRPFYVTHNLHAALKELRSPDHDRLLWIDAICINQADHDEKSSQVQIMRDIYANALKTIVWLGPQTKATVFTIIFIEQLSAATHRQAFWEDRTHFPQWRRIRGEIINILECAWWERAWIIQEVVLSKLVVVQRGSHQICWEALHNMLNIPHFIDGLPDVTVAVNVTRDVQNLRSEEPVDPHARDSLLGLVYRFRSQSATFGSDKIYALMGLLENNHPSLLTPDYDATPEAVFIQLTISSLEHNKTLTAIALAAGAELQGISWCRDWRLNWGYIFEVLWFSTHPPPTGAYTASGTQPPVYSVDYQRRLLSLQGYELDTVVRVGSFHQSLGSRRVDWYTALLSWELLAGGQLPEGSESKLAFDRTITAGHHIEPMDWRTRVFPISKSLRSEEELAYNKVLEDRCIDRRFFVTKSGRFGLGTWNMKKGDIICLLFGGKAPFVLRKRAASKEDRGKSSEEGQTKNYYRVIGEAYIDGMMYYKGSLEDDITSGKVVPQWYNLL